LARFDQLALVDLFLEQGAPIDARSVAGNTCAQAGRGCALCAALDLSA
jgi:hypothetical protein